MSSVMFVANAFNDNLIDPSHHQAKPCPFCGSAEKLHLADWNLNLNFVYCDACSCQGPDVEVPEGEDGELHHDRTLDAWNQRRGRFVIGRVSCPWCDSEDLRFKFELSVDGYFTCSGCDSRGPDVPMTDDPLEVVYAESRAFAVFGTRSTSWPWQPRGGLSISGVNPAKPAC